MYDLFSDLFDGFDWFMQPTTYKEEKKCPVCGRTYSDFRRDGKLGCSECYKVFRGPVTETLRQIHPSTVHVGKIPSKSGEELKLKRKNFRRRLKMRITKQPQNFINRFVK